MLTVLVKQHIWSQNLYQTNKLGAQLEENRKGQHAFVILVQAMSTALTNSKSTRLLASCCMGKAASFHEKKNQQPDEDVKQWIAGW